DIWLAVGRILDHGEETLSQCFRDSTSCSQQFARVGLRLFAKVVRQYRCSLPRSAWHDGNNCTRPISAASSVARPDQCDRHRQLIERVHEPATKDCVTSGSGTFVWTGPSFQAGFDDLEPIGLPLLYPALERTVCAPGHHGYPRTSDLILRKALKGRWCHQITDATARPFLHLLNPTRRPRQVNLCIPRCVMDQPWTSPRRVPNTLMLRHSWLDARIVAACLRQHTPGDPRQLTCEWRWPDVIVQAV